MSNRDGSNTDDALPAEIDDLYRADLITAADIDPLLNLRHELVQAAPQPGEDFQNQLATRLRAEFEQQQRSSRRIQFPRRVTVRLAIALVAVLTIGAGTVLAVHSVLQQFIRHDAGLNAIVTANQGIELNQRQTIGDYTVHLKWANADNNRLTLGFTVSGFVCPADYRICDIRVMVFDRTGREIPMIDGKTDERQSVYSHLYNFDLSGHTRDQINNFFQLQVIPYGMTDDGTDPAQPDVIRGRTVTLSDPITLNFNVPVSDDVHVYDTPQTATDDNIIMTLRRVTVSPSQSRVAVCFIPPVPEKRWTTIPRLTINDTEIADGGTTNPVSGIGESSTEVCNEHLYNIAMPDDRAEWQMEIVELIGFGTGGNDRHRISGAWVFEFVVP